MSVSNDHDGAPDAMHEDGPSIPDEVCNNVLLNMGLAAYRLRGPGVIVIEEAELRRLVNRDGDEIPFTYSYLTYEELKKRCAEKGANQAYLVNAEKYDPNLEVHVFVTVNGAFSRAFVAFDVAIEDAARRRMGQDPAT